MQITDQEHTANVHRDMRDADTRKHAPFVPISAAVDASLTYWHTRPQLRAYDRYTGIWANLDGADAIQLARLTAC